MEYEKAEERDIVTLLVRFLRTGKRYWLCVLTLCLLGGGISFWWAKTAHRLLYEASAVVSVSYSGTSEDILSNSFDHDANTAKRAEEAFRNLLETQLMEQLLLTRLGTKQINGTISVSPMAGSNTFEMTVQSTSARDAYDILQGFIAVYPQAAVYDSQMFQMLLRQEPTVPDAPANSFDGAAALMKGCLLGLAAGCLLLAVLTVVKHPVSGAQDVKELLDIPLLAEIPHISGKNREGFLFFSEQEGLHAPMRSLRIRLHQLLSQGEQVIAVTSTLPGEGKSTIAANLALSLGAEGHRVVLVDGDVYDQKLYRQLGCEPSRYHLMDLLQDSGLDPCKNLTAVEDTGLHLLSGSNTADRFCWVEDAKLTRVLDKLKRAFDYVILDCPAGEIGSPVTHIARQADLVLYVIRPDGAEKRWIREGIERLCAQEIPVRGCVLNHSTWKD